LAQKDNPSGLRVAGQRLLADWREFQVKLARWQAMEQELQGNLAVFGDLTPEGLSFCADYEASKLRLEGELEKAIAAEKQLVERQENYLQTKGAFERDFGDLLDLVPEARQAVREKQRLEQQLREGERERTLLEKRGLQTRSLTALLLALSGLLAGILAHNLLLALGGGALLGLLGWGIGGIISQHQHAPIRSHLAARLDDWRKELQQANALLGLWSREPLEKLDELSYRLWEREHRRQELDQVEASRPTETEESEVREARKAAGQRLDSFRAATATVRARFADVAEAYRRYQDLLVTAEELRQEVIRFARQETGTSPEGAATAPVDGLTSPWRELRVLAEIRGAEGAATGQILDWLQKMDDFVWQGLEQEAARWEDSVSTLQRLEDRRRSLLQGGDTGETVLLRLERGINHLRGKVAPFNEETPLESLRPLLEEAGEVQRRLTELDGTLNLASNQVKDLRDAKETIEQEVQSRSGRLSRILGAGGGDLARAHERLRDWRFRQEETGKLKSQLSGALGGRALADLENEAIDAGNQALAIWQEWQALVRDHPGLPSPGNQDNSEAIERHFRDLKEEVAGLKGQADTLSVRLQELILRRAQLEGSQPLNVAVGEDLLARKEAEVRRIKLEAEALGLAYRELEAAAQEFSSTYRQTLMEATTRYFQDFTGRPNRRVTLEEDFSLGIVEDASAVSLAQISRGTLDQLYLAARLAIGDMVGGEVALPFLFDDPFHNCDSDRLERIRFSLGRLAQERQILLLSHDDKFLNWGQAVKLKQSPGKG
ncbi:MAG: hypothetical protein M1299_11350, partial [Firmicutes bacterium]|nr:hypothetical protein [Bacillota bacterium]